MFFLFFSEIFEVGNTMDVGRRESKKVNLRFAKRQ